MTNETKPCPLCGGKANKQYNDFSDKIEIMCCSCLIKTSLALPDKCIEIWNRRKNLYQWVGTVKVIYTEEDLIK